MTIFIAILLLGFIVCMILLAGVMADISKKRKSQNAKDRTDSEESANIKRLD
ncbi:MAG: hypothetical protein WD098_11370 [Balneolales bacterium]